MTLEEAVRRRVQEAGGVRELARKSGVDAGYISRLKAGDKEEPSELVLLLLGLKCRRDYDLLTSVSGKTKREV